MLLNRIRKIPTTNFCHRCLKNFSDPNENAPKLCFSSDIRKEKSVTTKPNRHAFKQEDQRRGTCVSPFKNKFRFTKNSGREKNDHLIDDNSSYSLSNASNLNTDSFSTYSGVLITNPDPGDESKTRVDTFTKKFERKKNDIQIKGEILYGLHPVYLALKNGKRKCHKLFLKSYDGRTGCKRDERDEILQLAEEKGVTFVKANTRMLDIIATGHVHQGVCMDVSSRTFTDAPHYDRSESLASISLWVLLDYIQDPMNFGAILRSSFYFGVDKIIVNGALNCRLSPVVSKASSGVLEAMDVHGAYDVRLYLERLKEEGLSVIGTKGVHDANSTNQNVTNLHSFTLEKSAILVIGNEGKGLAPEVKELCDSFLVIPRFCDALDSLNVSVATGIMLHHLSRFKKHSS